MARYLLIALCISSIINGAEKSAYQIIMNNLDSTKPCNEDQVQLNAMLTLLNDNGIETKDKKILNFCYGTEALSAQLAQESCSVHSSSQKKEMTDSARAKYGAAKNIVFSHEFPQKDSQDLAIGIFSLDLIKDKQTILENIYSSLKPNGECFFTIVTSSNPLPLSVAVGREIVSSSFIAPVITWINSQLSSSKSVSVSVTDPYLSDDELKKMICNIGFTLLNFESQKCSITFPNRQAVENVYRPIFMNIETVQLADTFFNGIPYFIRPEYCTIEHHIQDFFSRITAKMKKTSTGEYIDTLTTTVVYVKKP